MIDKKETLLDYENILVQLEHDPSEADGKSSELEEFWNSIHGLQEKTGKLFKKQKAPSYSFEIFSDGDGAGFFFNIPKRYKNVISKKLNAVYPYIEIKDVDNDYLKTFDRDYEFEEEGGIRKEKAYIESYELRLTEHQSQALKMKGADKTFLNGLINSMNHFDEDESSIVQIIVKPLPDNWGKRQPEEVKLQKFGNANIVVRGFLYLFGIIITGVVSLVTGGRIGNIKEAASTSEKNNNKNDERKDDKMSKPCFNVSVRVASKSTDPVIARENAKSIATTFNSLDNKNRLRPVKINIQSMKDREVKKAKNNAMCASELTQFAHLPGPKVMADSVNKHSVKMPYDKRIPNKGIVFGTAPSNNEKEVAFPMVPLSKKKYVEISKEYEKTIDNICKPRLVLGQMGTGKSEWIINYAINLAKMGISLIVVDPKNDTQQRLIESLPDEVIHLVDYIDLGDLAFPAAMNILRKRKENDPTEVSMIVTSLINFFKKEFGKSWGFAMQQLIQMTGNAILLDEVSTMYEFQLMLTNKEYRGKMISKMEDMVADPNTKSKAMLRELVQYWRQFHSMTPREQRNMISSTMNKIGVFMSNRLIRSIVSQRESYDFRKAGDEGRITIVNIPEGILTPENARLLASFINKAIWLDFQSRAEISLHDRYPTMWLIEEAHMVMDEEFLGVLTKSRGYRLGVTIITQGLTNFDGAGAKEIKELIMTNCKNKILFRLGHADARAMAEEFGPNLTSLDLMNCPDYHFYGKVLLEGGKVSDPFFGHALLPAPELRSYDEYKENHKSGKLNIDDVEDQLDKRHELNEPGTIYNMGDDEEDEKPKKVRNKNSKRSLELDKIG